jgi:4-aminobutyrate aminotransferase-like enzyme
VSALISTDTIVAAEPFSRPSASSSSYGGNPLGAAAALATIEAIEEEHLVERAADLGRRLQGGLRELQERYRFIGDVRGAGLMIGLDLVADRTTKAPLARPITERIFLESLRRGLLLMGYFPRVRINPPLTITAEQIDEGLAILDEVFGSVAAEAERG